MGDCCAAPGRAIAKVPCIGGDKAVLSARGRRVKVDGQRRSVARRIGGVAGDRRVIYASNRNGDRGNSAVESPVVGLEGKTVLAAKVSIGSVDGCRPEQIHKAVARLGDDRIRQRLSVRVVRSKRNRRSCVFGRCHRLIIGHRGLIGL